MQKKISFWVVLIIIIKISFISFGGGNAIFPIIKKEVLEKRKWLEEDEFNNLIVKTNLLPGPSIVQSLSYIAIKILGFWKGSILILLALIPHILLFFSIFLCISYLPQKYLYVVSVAVLPTIAGIVLAFTINFIKKNKNEINKSIFWLIFLFTLAYSIFMPAPFNAPIFPMIFIIIYITIVYIVSLLKSKKEIKGEQND
ncbi:chromate transporter [Mycoplasma elephantis]|uniref:chromate transporter n=1 Tax=Mycoplasma elephantis TaxID=114882 RepID=UPI000482CDF0|nr:chromate transporter [Mycoplasma elephantis]